MFDKISLKIKKNKDNIIIKKDFEERNNKEVLLYKPIRLKKKNVRI